MRPPPWRAYVHLHDVALQCLPHLARTDVDVLVHTLHRDECRTCRIEIHLADELWRGHAPYTVLPGTHFLEVATHLQLMDHLLQLVAVLGAFDTQSRSHLFIVKCFVGTFGKHAKCHFAQPSFFAYSGSLFSLSLMMFSSHYAGMYVVSIQHFWIEQYWLCKMNWFVFVR
jgi:hypothetical protein